MLNLRDVATLNPELALLDHLATKFVEGSGVPREMREGLTALTATVDANPDDAESWFRRGAVLQGLGRPLDALGDLREALRIVPHHAKAWLLLSEVLPALGEYEAGRAARLRALELDSAVAR